MDINSESKKYLTSFNQSENEKNSTEKRGEFLPETVAEFNLDNESKLSRRKFLALLAASAALSTTACNDYRDKGKIIPYNKRPEGVLPGTANYYASTCTGCSDRCGILVKTREGRPIKIDGNPDNPINKGKICATGQASVLDLYDPGRLKKPLLNKKETAWTVIDDKIITELENCNKNNLEIAIIADSYCSPVQVQLFNDFINKYPTTKIYSFNLFDNLSHLSALNKLFGTSLKPKYLLNKAKIIVSVGSDFLGKSDNLIENIDSFVSNRNVDDIKNFNRLYSVEGNLSLTGSNADYRFVVNPVDYDEFLLGIINELNVQGLTLPNELKELSNGHNLLDVAKKLNLDIVKLKNLIKDILSNRNSTIFIPGSNLLESNYLLVYALNQVINNSELLDFTNGYKNALTPSAEIELKNLIERMKTGKVGMVINWDTDPVYGLAKGFGFESGFIKVKNRITLCESLNDTAELSNFVLPINNQLESWGLYNTKEGIYSFQQPVIAPIFDTREKEGVLLGYITGKYDEFAYYSYIQNFFKANILPKLTLSATFEEIWNNCLHDGVVAIQNSTVIKPVINLSALSGIKPIVDNNNIVVLLERNYFIKDGRFANNGWLQEIPHPISKIAWDNYAAISKKTANKLNLKKDDVIEITKGNRKIKIAVLIQPGVAENLIAIELGYGRGIISDVGKDVGVNSNILLNDGNDKFVITGVSVKKTGEEYLLASSQEHNPIDEPLTKELHRKRNIIQEGTVLQYIKNPKFLEKHEAEVFSITKEMEYKGVKWAMSIDLNKCIGCGICVSSCNVENNIPVVGKEQYNKGREMQWMRIDRYYSGEEENPIVSNQPMLCQHCDNAPCENVCPVNATNHSEDGLNQMTYNRCVGTRYCSNNCPYKVRRFNFFNFRDHFENAYYDNDLSGLVNNPEVTVRSRGVMEKCTFCVQRIMEARQEAIKNNVPLKGTDVITACQQACPSNAIVFGDVNDKNSEIYKLRNHDLGYHVLEALNIKPNVTYIAKLRNTHSEEL
jgi:molybdopterin-containing oxidoreductase family iron-sulfur binding subunit